ncbi:hypothetical protein [Oceanobacter mangrovi]|uniref:hypothetical protein n=1 Tax=Oceanobacter mangrovi TaxID=2862510 RepID=UPI001C8D7ACF|nr:hypothetical protein [Oceanobacter mangrovi]
MDLQDFKGQDMYFDEPMAADVEVLLDLASSLYGDGGAEQPLLQARQLAPGNMTVLVALYRFYYYQHRLAESLIVAHEVMNRIAPEIGFPDHWRDLSEEHLVEGLDKAFTTVRFYLLALKGAAFLNLRMGNRHEAVGMLNKLVQFDSKDRLGARSLLQMVGPTLVTEDGAVAALR